MSGTRERLAGLSPERRALLQQRLRERTSARADAQEIRPRETEAPAPLSFAQQRLWFVHQLEPGTPTYNMMYTVRLRGPLDAGALRGAFSALAHRHEVLRTVFESRGAEPVQVVRPPAGVPLPLVDLRGVDAAGRDAEARRLARAEALRPFDLARGPLLRATLVALGEGDHLLLWCVHHIVSDDWSMGVLVRELSALYTALGRGRAPALPPLPVQYADYALWQRERLTEEVARAQLDYWRERLAGAPPRLELPTDRPAVAGHEAQRASGCAFVVPGDAARALRALGRRTGASLFMVILSAWQLLLSRYAGEDDVVVGTPISGRTRVELEGLIGLFVNMLALRADLSGNPTFTGLVERVREGTLGAYQHQDIPFERVVDELKVERSFTHPPLFQVIFSLVAAGAGEQETPALGPVRVEPFGEGSANNPHFMDLGVTDGEDRLTGQLIYRASLFDPPTVERMVEHFRVLLETVAADPDRPIGEISLLGAAERARLLVEWNATDRPYALGDSLHARFEAQARRTPDAVAVVADDEQLTYAALDTRANRLARHLRALGVGAETRVGVCLERSAEMVVALLGVLKSGGAYVPIDPAYPADRIAYMLADSAVPVVLTQERLADTLPEHAARVVVIDRDWDVIERESADPLASNFSPDQLAYVIYTSGSTGRPKGAMNAHRGVVNRIQWMQDEYGLAADDVVLQKTPFSFDVSVWEFFWPLLTGARLVMARPGGHGDPAYLSDVIERAGVTTLHFVPSMLQAFLDAGDPARCGSLRRVVCSGEALSYELMERCLNALPSAALHNLYGPTEAAVDVTYWAAERRPDRRVVPIGRPVANTRIHVLDGALNLVPAGVAGELFIGGVQVGRGYLGKPTLTAEKFVPDPFSSEPGARLYRTGDRVRWMADGEIEYLGRIGFQVKVRGFRIELGEIEAALKAQPGVRDAVAVVREDDGDRRLAAYLLADDAALDASALKAALRTTLPEHMLPAAFVVLDAFPLTASGKLDRRALPALGFSADAAAYEPPRTATEEILAGLFAEVLGVERVGAADDFFALGGHSLLATRVVAGVRSAFGVELPLRAFFEAPTVRATAARVEQLRAGGDAVLPPLVPVPREGPVPLSFAQQRLWLLDQLDPASALYNLPSVLRLHGEVDAAALEAAFTALVARHEALRTTFPAVAGEPVQVIHPPSRVPLEIVDLAHLPASEREAEAQRRAGEEAARPFDLAAGPLFRTTLLRLTPDEHVLVMAMHHVVSDGWSMGILQREVTALYEAARRGEDAHLPPLPVQYADHAVWQRSWLAGAELDRQVAYWRGALAGAPPVLEVPTKRPRSAELGQAAASVPFRLPPETADAVRALGRAWGATLFMVVLAAWQALLSKYSGQDDVVVGAPIAGRRDRAVEGLIGFFVNTLVLRGDLSGDPSFGELLGRVRETTLDAYAHQDIPFEKLVEELGVERSLSHAPLFQAMLIVQGDEAGAGAAVPALRAVEVDEDGALAKFDLTLALAAEGGGLAGVLQYRADLFDAWLMERMAAHFAALLEAAAARPARRLSEIGLLRPAERAELVEWNATDRPYTLDDSLHARFEAQARRTPDAIAIVSDDEQLTYAELDARANRLARHLRGLGVRAETRVGVCLERSAEMVVALLGVLKSGGAYVPIDPAYPADRIAYMLADSAVPVVLTQERLADTLPEHAARVVVIDRDWDVIERESADPLASDFSPDQLAYVIYTSGSTGRPKGAMNAHRGVVNRIQWMQDEYGLNASDVVLQKTPFSFDVSVWEFFWPLLTGARLVMARPGGHGDPAYLSEVIERAGVTTLHFVPSMLQAFLDAGDPARCGSLRRVVCSGEALPYDLMERCLDALPSVALHNLYGPTEAAVDVTYWAAERRPDRRVVPIGRPVANTRIHVLDGALNLVPAGVAGELFIGGVQVGRGYLGRPALTAEKFIPDPLSSELGARMYRTGDRVRWMADGEIEYLGRIDFQVKVRGFRIELGEIEAALKAQPGVRDAVVVVREHEGDRRLVAYLIAQPDAELEAAALKAVLKTTLPEHMLPAAFVVLEAFPLTGSGKLDRRALPAPGFSAHAAAYVAPRTATEEILAGSFAEALGVERVGTADDFFASGGHSLLAARVVARVRDAFGVEVPLRTLFEAPTVAALAARVDSLRSAGGWSPPPLVPVPREGAMPLSFAQQRLWLLDQLDPASALYNLPSVLRLRGEVDAGALEAAFTALVARHEALRTTFPAVAGEPVQVIHPPSHVPLEIVDLAHLPAPEREAEAQRRAGEEAARPFDLAAGPLFRTTLLRIAPDDHVLVMAMHHVVSDGWSMGILQREVTALYEAARRGEDAHLPSLPVQYADYAVWQRSWLAGAELERQVAYWRGALAGAPPVLEVPTKRPRSAELGQAAASVPFRLPPETADAVRALGRARGATLFMVVLAAWQALLSKYSGQDDVVVGAPIAGRRDRAVEGLIGFFVNTLVLRGDLSGDPSFGELLGRVRETTLDAYAHQDIPFEKLVEELGVERSLSHAPLFQAMLMLQGDVESAAGAGAAISGLAAEAMDADGALAKFDLMLALEPDGAGLAGVLQYRADLFDAWLMERLAGHVAVLLGAVAADPDRPLAQVDLLGAAERERVLQAWNATDAPYPRESVHALFAGQAARTPDAPAVVHRDVTLTYAELADRAGRLANHLRAHGVRPEARVALCMERGVDAIVGMLGILQAGGAYVPVDDQAPPERVRDIIGDAGCVLTLTHAAWRGGIPGHPPAIQVDDPETAAAIAALPATVPSVAADPDQLAYVIYTSGSTGRPKGVAVPHRGIVRLVRDTGYASLGPGERVSQASSIAFDAATFEVWGALLNGGTLVVFPPGPHSLAEVGATVRAHGVTTLWITSGLFHRMVDDHLEGLRGLRQLLTGGEVLSPAHMRRVREAYPDLHLVSAYGPTENTTFTTCHTVARPPEPGAKVPIGVPIASTRVYVADAHGAPLPIGVPGELYAGGAGVARGYLGRPGQTAERFVPDPFSGEAGARLYRTGDRARWRTDGALEFVGRTDAQVKVRGFRVEPGEIEAAIAAHPGVRAAVVAAREDRPGDTRLVAYVVAEDPASPVDAGALRSALSARLPAYMVPAAVVAMESLPVNQNGKVDRRALPAPHWDGEPDAFVAPRTPAEARLAAIWAEVLGVERVGVEDDFFARGGHSLLATRVVARVRDAFGVEVPLRALFESPTVAGLAARVAAARDAGAARVPPVRRVERDGPFPLSFAQERFWDAYLAAPRSAALHIPFAVTLRGPLDPRLFRRVLTEVARRHEPLRTVYAQEGGPPVQVVLPPAPVPLPEVDLRGLPPAARTAQAQALAARDAARPFDLRREAPFRATLLRMDDEERVLLFTLHHIAGDRGSTDVLVHEVSALYQAFAAGRASPLPEPEVRYADFALWQRESVTEAVLQGQLRYWARRLEGADEALQLAPGQPLSRGDRSRMVGVRVADDAAAALRALGRGEGCSPFMTMMAVWQALLARRSGRDDLCVGIPVAGRPHRELEGLIGFFSNTLVIRADLSGAPTFRGLLRRVREATLQAYAHQDLPFARLVSALRPEPDPGGMPLFRAVFDLEHTGQGAGEGLRLPGVSAGGFARSEREQWPLRSDVRLNLVDDGVRLAGGLTVRTDVLDTAGAERLAREFEALAAAAAAGPDRPLAELAPHAQAP